MNTLVHTAVRPAAAEFRFGLSGRLCPCSFAYLGYAYFYLYFPWTGGR